MGSSFECDGVARELTLVKVFSSDFGGTRPYLFLYRLVSGPIFFVQQRVVPRNYYYFCLYSN